MWPEGKEDITKVIQARLCYDEAFVKSGVSDIHYWITYSVFIEKFIFSVQKQIKILSYRRSQNKTSVKKIGYLFSRINALVKNILFGKIVKITALFRRTEHLTCTTKMDLILILGTNQSSARMLVQQ